MVVVGVEGLSKAYGERCILAGASFSLDEGERVGLVGPNGCGKSTLARILAGVEEPDAGRVTFQRNSRVLYLEQEPTLEPGVSARDTVLAGLEDWYPVRTAFEKFSAQLEAGDLDASGLARVAAAQADAGAELERLGGWERLHEAEAVLGHVGIDDPVALVDRMSGGQRRRVALARLLVAQPEVAILDEPTNHLDIPAIEWLEEFLVRRFKGAVLLVTHDRAVLDNVVSRTLEIDGGSIESYDGGYEAYLMGKADREAYAERVESNRRNYLRTELEWLRRSPKARSTKQKARVDRAQEALAVQGPEVARTAAIAGSTVRSGKTVLGFENVAIGRGDQCFVEGIELHLAAGERLGIVGPNGCGKSTLLATILGELEPLRGRLERGVNTRIGYLDQARGGLRPELSIFENVAQGRGHVMVGEQSLEPAQYLERFLFDRPSQRRPLAGLSGGERARVALAKMLADPSNLLLLDEPTNDLDVETLSALELMLSEYGGAVVLVTHDRRLLDRVATRTLVIEDGRAVVYAGGYEDARSQGAEAARRRREEAQLLNANAAKAAKAAKETKSAAHDGEDSSTAATAKKRPALTYGERLELEGLLDRIDEADNAVAALETKLADPDLYAGGGDVAALASELRVAQGKAQELLDRWEHLETKKAHAT